MHDPELQEALEKLDPVTLKKFKSEVMDTANSLHPDAEESSQEDIEKILKMSEESYLRMFARSFIQDPELLDKSSFKPNSLGWWQSSHIELYKKNGDYPFMSEDSEDSMSLKELLPGIDLDKEKDEDILREALLRLIRIALDFRTENREIGDSPGFSQPLHSELQNLATNIDQKLQMHMIVYQYRAASYEADRHIPFSWKGFLTVFDKLALADAYSIYFAETIPEIWEKRGNINLILDHLEGEHPYIEVDGEPFKLSSIQAAYLRILIEAPGPMHYLDIWEKATGEKIGDEYGANKNKALPRDVFKSKPTVKDCYIEHYGKAKSGLYKIK